MQRHLATNNKTVTTLPCIETGKRTYFYVNATYCLAYSTRVGKRSEPDPRWTFGKIPV